MSFDEAREYSEAKNTTLPIITDEGIDKVFQQFVANDSSDVIHNSSVWLGAYARPLNESVNWHWMNGQPSSTDNTVTLTQLYRHSISMFFKREALPVEV